MNGSTDEKQGLLDKNHQPTSSNDNIPDPLRSILPLTNNQETSGPNSNDAFVQDVDDVDKPTTPARPDNYGYLEHLQSLKPLLTADDKALSKKVKVYYVRQLELIKSVEDILLPKSDETKQTKSEYEKEIKRRADVLSMATLLVNFILVVVKIFIASITHSLSIISSLVDSTLDLFISLILLWTDRKMKNLDIYKYPEGRKRLEPISIVMLSVIMCSSSILIIFRSAETLDDDIEYFAHQNTNTSMLYSLPSINMGTVSIVVMVAAVGILFIFCYRINTPTMRALAEANLNDVASNAVALICGLIASEAAQGAIKQQCVVFDPVGAILISVYIIVAWILQANRQIRRLTGISADPFFLQRITHVVYNYRPDAVHKIGMVQAVHHGTHFFVEVHIALPGPMPLSEAHDIGAQLQHQLETINDIERAFVHLDFDFSRATPCEHKIK